MKYSKYGYYDKEPKDLNLDEASMLAGVPNAPSVYSPNVNPDLAKKRQAHVIEKMKDYGYISQNATIRRSDMIKLAGFVGITLVRIINTCLIYH